MMADEATAIGDVLKACNDGALPLVHQMRELCGLERRLMRAAIEPSIAASELLDREPSRAGQTKSVGFDSVLQLLLGAAGLP